MNTLNSQQKPDNFLVWAILSTFFCCLFTGFVAIYHANRVDTLWYEGKKQESIEAMQDARKWTFITAGIGVVGYITFLLFGISGFMFYYSLLLLLWFTYQLVNAIATMIGLTPLLANLLLIGLLCWLVPILYNWFF
ncbi:MAG: CD225/dispanin family protein [Bacteroidaceae bacterium]|nr:CD225/dispanin family protein [Bacteroidaceae bacterium]